MSVTDFGDTHLKQERAKRTRQDILLAAARTFQRTGYAAARLDEIGRDAAVTKGALYFHFRSKAELAQALVLAHRARWAEIEDDVKALELDALTSVVALSFAVARNYRSSDIARAGVRLGNEAQLIPAELPRPFVGWISDVTALLKQAQAEGTLHPQVNPGTVARSVVASYVGLQDVSARLTEGRDLIRRLREWWQLFLPGIVASPELTAVVLDRFGDRGTVRG